MGKGVATDGWGDLGSKSRKDFDRLRGGEFCFSLILSVPNVVSAHLTSSPFFSSAQFRSLNCIRIVMEPSTLILA